MSAKVVVFGGAGFLGSHVADQLSNEGYKVTIFDQRASDHLRDDQEMIVGDILDLDKIIEVTRNALHVYHFAGIADISEAADRPLDTVKLNILGTANILEALRQNSIQRFVFASSLYVYSDLGSFYRSSKQACELLIEDYQKKYNVPFTVLRFGSLYGDRSNQNNFVHKAITNALLEGCIERRGDGEEIRKYIHVGDAARASVNILDEKYKNQHIMITGQNEIKVNDILTMFKEIIGEDVVVEYKEAIEDEHYKTTPFSFSPRTAKYLHIEDSLELYTGISEYVYKVYHELKKNNASLTIDLQELQKLE